MRKFEKTIQKLATTKQDVKYLNRCEELDLIPDYLQFNPPGIEAYQDTKLFYRKALVEQRKVAYDKLKVLRREYTEMYNGIKDRVSVFKLQLLIFAINNHSLNKIKHEKDVRHKKKLYNLWNKQKTAAPNCVVNLSNKELTLMERNALMFGPGHHLLPKAIEEMALKSEVESQINKICKQNQIQLTYDNKTNLRRATDNFLHESISICNTKKNKAMHNTLENLKRNNKIKCLKMDKGVGIVILNTEDYYSKLDKIVQDTSKFKRIDYSLKDAVTLEHCENAPWVAKEQSIRNYTWKYIKPIVTDGEYYKLLPKGSKPGRLYGMAKNHKKDCPLRPVLSAIDTAEYALSKWIEAKIKPFYDSIWSVTSTNSFVEDLNTIKPCSGDVCVSFDIKSLFTNVPLKEVVDDVANVVYDDEENCAFNEFTEEFKNKNKNLKGRKLTKKVFKNILMACSKNVFLYNENVYEQIDGLSMGSPLSPILANWFVAKVENSILKDQSINQPKFYRRYVDDIFAVFRTKEDKDIFFKKLNEAHQSLSFTMENVNTSSRSLPFLDVEISIKDESFQTKVYKKPTNTEVLINYEAMAPKRWKQAVIKCFLTRAKRVCSSKELFDKEVSNIKRTFAVNAYPERFVNEVVEEFLRSCGKETDSAKITPAPHDQATTYFVLPYIGKASERLQRKVKKEISQHNVDVKPAYRTTKVEQYMCLKSTIPSLLKTNLVYKFQCPCDKDVHYIGETERQFFRRILDHITCSTGQTPTAVCEHIRKCDRCAGHKNIADCFSIIRSCSRQNILAQEALSIKVHRPSLNVQLGGFQGARTVARIF